MGDPIRLHKNRMVRADGRLMSLPTLLDVKINIHLSFFVTYHIFTA